MSGPIDVVYPSDSPVDKSAVRYDDKTAKRRSMANADAVRSVDLSGQFAGVYIQSTQFFYDIDTSDTTTVDDMTDTSECIRDNQGNGFFRVAIGSGDVASETHAASSKATPVDADEIPLVDSAASNILKKLTWANLKATIAAYLVSAGWIRERLTANRTYYVATTGGGGSDSNDGLTALTPFLTIQKAVDVLIGNLDLGGFSVTVQVADGTYTGGTIFSAPWTGGGSATIQGNSGSPGNVIISTTSIGCFTNSGVLPGTLTIKDMELRTTTSGSGINNTGTGFIGFQNINFGACATAHIITNSKGSKIQAVGNYTINGNTGYHMLSLRGEIEISARTVTLTGTPAFSSAFAFASRLGYIGAEANTFSGSATGVRYSVSSNAVIYTGGGGASYLPGNSAGSEASGGRYV